MGLEEGVSDKFVGRNGIILRLAVAEDVADIVSLLADDPLGQSREAPGDPAYERAFQAIDQDPNNELWVLDDGAVAGTMQLTIMPGLSRKAATRAQIESVRVADRLQGLGMGTWCFECMIERARQRGADMVQLTSDVTRPDAHRFYEKLGFVASHTGFKLFL